MFGTDPELITQVFRQVRIICIFIDYLCSIPLGLECHIIIIVCSTYTWKTMTNSSERQEQEIFNSVAVHFSIQTQDNTAARIATHSKVTSPVYNHLPRWSCIQPGHCISVSLPEITTWSQGYSHGEHICNQLTLHQISAYYSFQSHCCQPWLLVTSYELTCRKNCKSSHVQNCVS